MVFKALNRVLTSWYLVLALAMAIAVSCSDNLQSDRSLVIETPIETSELNIWWEKGYSFEEDRALQTVVTNWQNQSAQDAKLTFYTNSELSTKIERAVVSGNLPDIIMNNTADRILYPRLAWEGKLEDVADLIEPNADNYSSQILRSATYKNSLTEKSTFYTVPLYQATTLIFYWQKLLAEAGFQVSDIPQEWEEFWQFWHKVKVKLENKDIYDLGLPFTGNNGTDDMYIIFEHILEAYNISLLDERGKLLVDVPEVRQGIIDCLAWYGNFYRQNRVPPDAIDWSGSDNNRHLLNRGVIMTPNTTLSIPAAVSQDADTYYHKLGIVEFPNKPDGNPMQYLIAVRQAAIFADSPHVSLAKDFLRYFMQPTVMKEYLQASGNRNQPVQQSLWRDPLWQETNDPYLAVATKVFTKGKTRLFDVAKNPAYSNVLQQNIWGKALNRIAVEGLSAEEAGNDAIAQIIEIFDDWQ